MSIIRIEHKTFNSTIELKKYIKDEGHNYDDIESLVFYNCNVNEIDFNFLLSLRSLVFTKCNIGSCKFINISLYELIIHHSEVYFSEFYKCDLELIKIEFSSLGMTTFEKCIFENFVIYTSYIANCKLWKIITRELNADSIEPFIKTDLSKTKGFESLPMRCPRIGDFIGWKKCVSKKHFDKLTKGRCSISRYASSMNARYGMLIVKLLIPEDAKRSSGTGHKCRCDKAIVLEVQDLVGNKVDTIAMSCFNAGKEDAIAYKAGETVYADSFDENRFNECSHGIHFFMSKEEAIAY